MTTQQQNSAIYTVSAALIIASVAIHAGLAPALFAAGAAGIFYIVGRS